MEWVADSLSYPTLGRRLGFEVSTWVPRVELMVVTGGKIGLEASIVVFWGFVEKHGFGKVQSIPREN